MLDCATLIKMHRLYEPHLLILFTDDQGCPATLSARESRYYILPFKAFLIEGEGREDKILGQCRALYSYSSPLHKILEMAVTKGVLSVGMLFYLVAESKDAGRLDVGGLPPAIQDSFTQWTCRFAFTHGPEIVALAELIDDTETLKTDSRAVDKMRLDLTGDNPRERK